LIEILNDIYIYIYNLLIKKMVYTVIIFMKISSGWYI
jgi:hypothetical protein